MYIDKQKVLDASFILEKKFEYLRFAFGVYPSLDTPVPLNIELTSFKPK